MIMNKRIAFGFLLSLLFNSTVFGQTESASIPKIIEKGGRHALLVEGKPYFMLGGQAHNSSAWPGMMPQVWTAVEKIKLNTLEVPLYWEQIEPRVNSFDFSFMDTLLLQSRKHGVHLVLLWFGTWKNGSSHYMPEWMKQQPGKYPNITGKDGKPVDSPSPHYSATLEADKKAFAAVMRYLKNSDKQHTVLLVQVENEPGAWGSVRDYSPVAQKLFEGQVPTELLQPKWLTQLQVPVVSKGTWSEVFGANADEYFHAWSVAHFIGQVAAAGKAEYALPLYVNAALRDPLTNPSANSYESGGATDNVLAIWKAAAPAIDLLAPDIYLNGSEKIMKVIELYDRPDNTLFVPELGLNLNNAKYLYEVVARGGIGFSPFGIDDNGSGSTDAKLTERLAPFALDYVTLAPMMRELAQWGFDGKIKSVVEREDGAEQTVSLGDWQGMVSFGRDKRGATTVATTTAPALGRMMIVQQGENQFLLIGANCHITFKPVGKNEGKAWQYLKAEEGHYESGSFKLLRILNGDETDFGGPRFGAVPVVVRTTLIVR